MQKAYIVDLFLVFMQLADVLKSVKTKIRPSRSEYRTITAAAKKIISKIKVPHTSVVVGGSFAKDTWMKEAKDIDVYVRFDCKEYKDQSEQISDILERALRKHFTPFRLHGSRNYFQVLEQGYTFEIVPIVAIKKAADALNITDFSSFHVAYVRKHKRLVDEIRLAKAFTKACGTYGAESYIRGFSGYVLELLVITYGSFLKLAKAATKWKPKVIIGDKRKAERLSWAKKVSPLILIDPVQPDRNAAAALSDEKFWTFVMTCKNFLQKPAEEFFVKRPVDVNDLRMKGSVVILQCIPLKGKDDVVGAKALKAFEFIKHTLCAHEFLLKDTRFLFGPKTMFYFVVDREPLSEYIVVIGPPVTMQQHVEDFKKKHPRAEVEDGRLVAHELRKYRRIQELLYDLVREDAVTSRVASLRHEILE